MAMKRFAVIGDRVYETGDDASGGMQPAGMLVASRPAPPPLMSLTQPDWMQARVAAGTYLPDEGMIPMPMRPDVNGGVFVAGGPTIITFIARPQKRYKAERLLATLVPTGTSVASARAIAPSGIFVGTDLQQGQLGTLNLGNYTSQAFGVRFSLTPAEPGVEITVPVALTSYPTGADSFLVILEWNGRYIH